MTQKITFQKSGETNAIQKLSAAGKKVGLKEIDNWLDNPQTDHKHDWIFRVKVTPFEISLNGEKRKVETIVFFVNANTMLNFFLTNALKNETTFELQWIEELVGKSIGFSESSPNTLVVDSIPLYYETKANRTALDLEIDWESITQIDGGFTFPLISPTSISLKNHNFTYNKVFWNSPTTSNYNDFIKQRLNEWKADQKPFNFYKAFLSFDNWLSVKESKNLYIVSHKGQGKATDLIGELNKEIPFIESGIAGWLKLPYQEREKFIKRYWEKDEEVENMKSKIEAAIRNLENDNPNKPPQPNQNNPTKTGPPNNSPWKVIIPIFLVFLLTLATGIIIFRKKKK